MEQATSAAREAIQAYSDDQRTRAMLDIFLSEAPIGDEYNLLEENGFESRAAFAEGNAFVAWCEGNGIVVWEEST